MLNGVPGILLEVVFHSIDDVAPINSDEAVSVCSRLLVPKPGSVHQFVDDDSRRQAAVAEGNDLLPALLAYHAGTSDKDTLRKFPSSIKK